MVAERCVTELGGAEASVGLAELVRELTDILKIFLSFLIFQVPFLDIVARFTFLKPL